MLIRDMAFYKAMWRIVLPVSLQSVVNMAVGLLATVMLGQLGETPLAASSLSSQYVFFFMILCFGVGGGALVMTAQYMGKGDIPSVKKVITLAIRIILVFSAVFSFAALFVPHRIMGIFSPEPDVIEAGVAFLRIIALQFVFQGLSTTLSIIGRSYGVVRVPLLASVCALAVSALFSWVFIFGNLGAPRMEIVGAALAIVLARAVEFVIIAGYIFFADKRVGYRLRDLLQPCRVIIPEYLRMGSPVIISDLFLALGMSATAAILGWLGQSMVSANAIVAVAMQLATVFLMGISNASGIMIGETVGMGDKEKAQAQGHTFLVISALMGIAAAGLILAITPVSINFFNVKDETVIIVYGLMYSLAVIMPFHCISTVLTKGILRGGGDTKFLMVADVLFLWIASLPLGYLAGFVFGLSPFWISIFLRIDTVIRSLWCAMRLYQGKWTRTVKSERELVRAI